MGYCRWLGGVGHPSRLAFACMDATRPGRIAFDFLFVERWAVHGDALVRRLSVMTERFQTVLILTALVLLAAVVGSTLGGATGLTLALVGMAAAWFPRAPGSECVGPAGHRRSSPVPGRIIVSFFDPRRAIASRGLSSPPSLYVLPDGSPQAFTIGERGDAAIVLSVGLTRALDRREVTGVLAHELSHVAHDDIRLMRFASTLTNVMASVARTTTLVALLFLPLILVGVVPFAPSTLLAVVVAPWAAQALLLALSRVRERAADDGAVRLTDDPEGLASALARLEAQKLGFWHRLFGVRPRGLPEWLQTHPPTVDRIRRLMGNATSRTSPPGGRRVGGQKTGPHRARIVVRRGPRTTILRAV